MKKVSTTVRFLGILGLVSTLMGALGCHDILAAKQPLPAGIVDPSAYGTPTGALELYTGAVYSFVASAKGGTATLGAFVPYVLSAGVLTDELQAGNLGGDALSYSVLGAGSLIGDSLDARQFPVMQVAYTNLQKVRANAIQAIGALSAYDPTASPALRGHLYAIEGYAEILLADFFCSGVPLSTLDFDADFTYHAGSTTQQVYSHALALLDTAILLSTDSARVLNLARVGKGRVLLGLGRYADAAQAVADVPTDFQYRFYVDWGSGTKTLFGICGSCSLPGVTMADREGGNGLPYMSGGDPRSFPEAYGMNSYKVQLYAPMKYGAPKPTLAPILVASGVEARLIEAEAALQSGSSSWLMILNTLRTDGSVVRTYTRTCQPGISVGTTTTQVGSPCPAGVIDTTWGLGNGSTLIPAEVMADTAPLCPTATGAGAACTDTIWYKGLRPLSDPGVGPLPAGKTAMDVRVDLLFRERAYWLYLTGQRQGDLRRLIRIYGRDPETVYPTGGYPLGSVVTSYGTDVSANISDDEYRNPLFTGCLSRGA